MLRHVSCTTAARTGGAMRRSGFTFVEILIVMIIIGLIAALGIPRIRSALQSQNVRSARAAVGTMVAKARAAAVQRSCRATLQLRSAGTAWVTACKTTAIGATGALDTLGGVENVAGRWNLTMSETRDSVRFDPRGLNVDYQTTVVRFVSGSIRDSVIINQLGKVVR